MCRTYLGTSFKCFMTYIYVMEHNLVNVRIFRQDLYY
jgi:hypothetical protein